MTIREFLTQHLTDNGLFDDEAAAVIELAARPQEQGGLPTMHHRLNDSLDGYPASFSAVLIMSIPRYALQWIDANKPKHWARPMFDPKQLAEILPK